MPKHPPPPVTFHIKNPAQVDAAVFLSNIGPDSLDVEKFEVVCGVAIHKFYITKIVCKVLEPTATCS
jgi:hypothetical protein